MVDHGRVLTTELECYRNEIVGCRFLHHATHRWGPGEEQMVERQCRESSAELRSAGVNYQLLWREVGRDGRAKDLPGSRSTSENLIMTRLPAASASAAGRIVMVLLR